MRKILEPLAWLSAVLGANPLLIQGPGGNISVKNGDAMWIKASGCWLSDALDRNIFLSISRREVLKLVKANREDFPLHGELRPSVETPLHAFLPQRIVLHLHMIDAIIHAGLPDAQSRITRLLGAIPWCFLPYARPGLPLSRLLRETLEGSAFVPAVLILKNHGVVIAAEDESSVISLVNDVMARLWLPPRPLPVPDIPSLVARNDLQWAMPRSPWPHALAFGEGAAVLCRGRALSPEQVVFLGESVCTVKPGMQLGSAVEDFRKVYGYAPSFAVFPECGVLFSPEMGICAEALVEGAAHAVLRIPGNTLPETLSEKDITELRSWEAEKRRKAQDSKRISSRV